MKKKLLSFLAVLALFAGLAVPACAAGETEIKVSQGGLVFELSQPTLGLETWGYNTIAIDSWDIESMRVTATAYALPFGTEISIPFGMAGYAHLYIQDEDCTWRHVGMTPLNGEECFIPFELNVFSQDPVTREVRPAGTTRDYRGAALLITNEMTAGSPVVSFITHYDPHNYNLLDPTESMAYPSENTITVNDNITRFYAYVLKDANGNDTNYIRLRDIAYIFNGTNAQFDIGYDRTANSITITTKTPYRSATGSEMTASFSDCQPYKKNASTISIDGIEVNLDAITLTDIDGNGYTYFKLRDLGKALGFNVWWNSGTGTIGVGTSWVN